MQGMTFGMDGPMINGWWVNPKTGDRFNAIDTYFEDNNLIIKTADGRILRYDQIQNYIQTDNPDSVAPTSASGQAARSNAEDIPANILAEIDNGDDLLIPDDNIYGSPLKSAPSAELGNIYCGVEPSPTQVADYDIIHRALNGKKSQLQFRGDIEWENFPQREIEMLIEVMNISEDEIVQYFINTISVDEVINAIKENIRMYIGNKLHLRGPSEEETQEGPKTEVTQSKRPDGKKTKRK